MEWRLPMQAQVRLAGIVTQANLKSNQYFSRLWTQWMKCHVGLNCGPTHIGRPTSHSVSRVGLIELRTLHPGNHENQFLCSSAARCAQYQCLYTKEISSWAVRGELPLQPVSFSYRRARSGRYTPPGLNLF